MVYLIINTVYYIFMFDSVGRNPACSPEHLVNNGKITTSLNWWTPDEQYVTVCISFFQAVSRWMKYQHFNCRWNYPSWGIKDQTMQKYGKFEGFPLIVHCLGWEYNDLCYMWCRWIHPLRATLPMDRICVRVMWHKSWRSEAPSADGRGKTWKNWSQMGNMNWR